MSNSKKDQLFKEMDEARQEYLFELGLLRGRYEERFDAILKKYKPKTASTVRLVIAKKGRK